MSTIRSLEHVYFHPRSTSGHFRVCVCVQHSSKSLEIFSEITYLCSYYFYYCYYHVIQKEVHYLSGPFVLEYGSPR